AAELPVLHTRAPDANMLDPAFTLLLSRPTMFHVIGVMVRTGAADALVMKRDGSADATRAATMSTRPNREIPSPAPPLRFRSIRAPSSDMSGEHYWEGSLPSITLVNPPNALQGVVSS